MPDTEQMDKDKFCKLILWVIKSLDETEAATAIYQIVEEAYRKGYAQGVEDTEAKR